MVRLKLRYLTCRVSSSSSDNKPITLSTWDILKAVKDSIQTNFGAFGSAALLSSLQVRYYDESTQIFILRCKREAHRIAWAAMTLLSSVSNQKAFISVLQVSGSVRTARREALKVLLKYANVESGHVEELTKHLTAQLENSLLGV